MSYEDLNKRSAQVGDEMRERGVLARDRVVVYMDNRPAYIESMFAAFRIGATVVPCNRRATSDEVAFIVGDCDARLLVTDSEVGSIAATAPSVLHVEDLSGLAGTSSRDPWAIVDTSPEDLAWIFYTSGTTGKPKGAMLSHSVLSFVTVAWLADLMPLDESDVTLHAAPLSHAAGFHALAATARAAHQIIPDQPGFDPALTLELIRSQGVTNTWMVPTQIIRLTEAASTDRRPVPTLQQVLYGGAPMSPAALQRALDTFGPIFIQLYGQGETPMTITVLRRQDHRADLLGTAGRPRLGIEVSIVDEAGHPVEPGSVGEVVVRGPSVMTGYWQRPDATAESLRDGWLHTGDLGRTNPEGVLTLLDRTKDLIISGGSNVYAVEVEVVLATSEAVADVAVVGIFDELWGERVEAVVVLASGMTLEDAALDTLARSKLAGYKVPRCYHVVDALPRNAYGKVVKSALRTMVQAEHQQEAEDGAE